MGPQHHLVEKLADIYMRRLSTIERQVINQNIMTFCLPEQGESSMALDEYDDGLLHHITMSHYNGGFPEIFNRLPSRGQLDGEDITESWDGLHVELGYSGGRLIGVPFLTKPMTLDDQKGVYVHPKTDVWETTQYRREFDEGIFKMVLKARRDALTYLGLAGEKVDLGFLIPNTKIFEPKSELCTRRVGQR